MPHNTFCFRLFYTQVVFTISLTLKAFFLSHQTHPPTQIPIPRSNRSLCQNSDFLLAILLPVLSTFSFHELSRPTSCLTIGVFVYLSTIASLIYRAHLFYSAATEVIQNIPAISEPATVFQSVFEHPWRARIAVEQEKNCSSHNGICFAGVSEVLLA